MPNIKEKLMEEFREEYKGILSGEILEQGNTWFENFLSSSIDRYKEEMMKCRPKEKVVCQIGAEENEEREYNIGFNSALKEWEDNLRKI